MIMSDFVKDPDTGEFYNNNYWSSTIEANKTALTTDWQKPTTPRTQQTTIRKIR